MALEVMRTRALPRAALEAQAYRLAVAGIALVLFAAGLWNATTLSPDLGYDAANHQAYAHLLIEEGRIPEKNVYTRALYDNPPGFYAVAGAAGKIGERLGLGHPDRAIQYANVLFALGAALLVLALSRELWPGRPLLQLGAFAFAAWSPLVVKAAALYHPGALALLLAAGAMYVAGRMLARRDYGLPWAMLLAFLLLAGVGVLTSSLWVYGAVVIAFAAAVLGRDASRRQAALALAAMLAVTAVAAAPWLVRQRANDVPLLGHLPALELPWKARPASAFVELGLPDVLTHPFRPSYSSVLIPTAYSDLWGDYFGNFAWNSSVDPVLEGSRAVELAAQSWAGLLPTALALAGLGALVALAVARRGPLAPRVLVPALPLLALLGFGYYSGNTVTPDGDTIKGIFLLTSTPGWALAFGFALDGVARGRARRPLLAALALAALVNVRFLVAGSPLGGLL